MALVGIVICLILATQVEKSGSIVVFGTVVLACVNWFLVKQKQSRSAAVDT
jgi:positive regulator of sigma E activity